VERDSLQTVLPALDRDRRARGLGRQTNLGLDPANDAAKDRALFRSRLARLGRSRHPGIQPLYLFHFLMRPNEQLLGDDAAALGSASVPLVGDRVSPSRPFDKIV